jgi:predicted O-methyltransferase YrrM
MQSVAFRLQANASRLEFGLLDRTLKQAGLANTNAIPTHMTRRELRVLHGLAATCPTGAVALEVGSYLGASCSYLATGLTRVNGRLICVDTWQNETMDEGTRDTFAEFTRNTAAVANVYSTIRKRSDELEPSELPDALDLVFLDGDHSYSATNGDFRLFAPRVAKGGIIAFHDAVAFEGVSRTIGEALASGEWQLVGHTDNLVWLRKAKPPK